MNIIEVVFFAVVAILVLARLYQVLGQNRGAPPPIIKDSFGNLGEKQTIPEISNPLPEAINNVEGFKTASIEIKYGALAPKILDLVNKDRGFSPEMFEANSAKAFEAIVTAFGNGELKTLEKLLTPAAYTVYKSAIEARQTNEPRPIEILKLQDPKIEDINITNSNASIDVRFISTLSEKNQKPRNNEEIWTFVKSLGQNTNIWQLSAVEPV